MGKVSLQVRGAGLVVAALLAIAALAAIIVTFLKNEATPFRFTIAFLATLGLLRVILEILASLDGLFGLRRIYRPDDG